MTTDASAPQSLPPPSPFAFVAIGAVFVAYFVALHAVIASGQWPMLSLGLVFLPWIVALASAAVGTDASRTVARRAAAVVALIAIGGLAWRFGADLALRADLLLYLENTAFLLALAALFATSLRAGREALVTRLARRCTRGGDMPPSVVRYTRVVTIVWAGYFTALALASTVLFVTQSRTVWSAFVNLAIWPLVAGGFVVEYAIRRRVLREMTHIPMMAGVHAFRQHAALGRGTVGRDPR